MKRRDIWWERTASNTEAFKMHRLLCNNSRVLNATLLPHPLGGWLILIEIYPPPIRGWNSLHFTSIQSYSTRTEKMMGESDAQMWANEQFVKFCKNFKEAFLGGIANDNNPA
jgi:hypothetical protein